MITQSPKILAQSLRPLLSAIHESSARKKILVLGDIGVDRYTIGRVERISPEAPVPIVWVQDERLKLGLAANVAENVQALGGEALLVGMMGEDRNAEDLRMLLRQAEISDRYCIAHPQHRTIVKERVVSDQQQLLRIDYETLGQIKDAELDSAVGHLLRDLVPLCDSIIIEDYAKGFVTPALIRKTVDLAQQHQKNVWVDPNAKSTLETYRGVQMLTPNRKEAEALTGMSDVESAGQCILSKTDARWVVITLGKDGMAVFERGLQSFRHVPTFAREVYDVSGAGDTVIATMALALSVQPDIEQAVVLGNIAAGLVVAKRGTATVSPQEIRSVLDQWGEKAGWDTLRL